MTLDNKLSDEKPISLEAAQAIDRRICYSELSPSELARLTKTSGGSGKDFFVVLDESNRCHWSVCACEPNFTIGRKVYDCWDRPEADRIRDRLVEQLHDLIASHQPSSDWQNVVRDFVLTALCNKDWTTAHIFVKIYLKLGTSIGLGDLNFLEKLTQRNPDSVLAADKNGHSALHLAIQGKSLELLWCLVKNCPKALDLEHNKTYQVPLLHWAANVGSVEVVKFLLEKAPELSTVTDCKFRASPLHWAGSAELADSLMVADGCDPDSLSATGETALQVAIRHGRFDIACNLVAFGCDLDVVSPQHGTALHIAIGRTSRRVVETLLAYGADVDKEDKEGRSPRHLAAKVANCGNKEPANNVLGLLHHVGAKRCPAYQKNCSPGCGKFGRVDGRLPVGLTFPLADPLSSGPQSKTSKNNSYSDSNKQRIRVLSLDGGGIRGLVSLMILRHLERLVGCGNIVDCFDYITGTSLSGLIALFLLYGGSNNKFSSKNKLVNMQRLTYLVRRQVLVGKRPYNSDRLVELLKSVFGEGTLMNSVKRPMIMVPALLTDRSIPGVHKFCNYAADDRVGTGHRRKHSSLSSVLSSSGQHESQGFSKPKPNGLVWEVGQATSSVPSYFAATSEGLIDGSLMANNPTLDAMDEIHELEGDSNNHIGLIVSIGTGREIAKKTNAADLENWSGVLDWIVKASDGQVVKHCRSWASDIGACFFRFSPLFSQAVDRDEQRDDVLTRSLYETRVYLLNNADKLKEVAAILLRRKNHQPPSSNNNPREKQRLS